MILGPIKKEFALMAKAIEVLQGQKKLCMYSGQLANQGPPTLETWKIFPNTSQKKQSLHCAGLSKSFHFEKLDRLVGFIQILFNSFEAINHSVSKYWWSKAVTITNLQDCCKKIMIV